MQACKAVPVAKELKQGYQPSMFILNKVGSFELTYLLNKEREREDADEITSGNFFHNLMVSGKNELSLCNSMCSRSSETIGVKTL